MDTPTLARENALWAKGVRHVAGLDEVGRVPVRGVPTEEAIIFVRVR